MLMVLLFTFASWGSVTLNWIVVFSFCISDLFLGLCCVSSCYIDHRRTAFFSVVRRPTDFIRIICKCF